MINLNWRFLYQGLRKNRPYRSEATSRAAWQILLFELHAVHHCAATHGITQVRKTAQWFAFVIH
jgi:hypothetical protein